MKIETHSGSKFFKFSTCTKVLIVLVQKYSNQCWISMGGCACVFSLLPQVKLGSEKLVFQI